MFNWPGLVSIIIFYLLILGIGLFAAWRQRRRNATRERPEGDASGMLLANRDINVFVGMLTLTATWVGGGYINGTAEYTYNADYGLVWCQAPLGYALSLCLGGAFFAGPMRRRGYVTMLDPLQFKFGEKMCGLLFIPAYLGEMFWSGAILSALGATLTVILELPNVVAIVVSAAVALAYTIFGGLLSVAYTDVVQLICMFIGLWITIPFAMTHPAVSPIAETARLGNVYTNKTWIGGVAPGDEGTYLDLGLMLIFGGIGWQVYFQRVLSAPTVFRAQTLSFAAAVGCVIMAVPAALIGAIGFSADWNSTGFKGTVPLEPDQQKLVLPLVLQYLCPTAVSFVGLGAVSAAVMSSADSSLLSASSMLARNVIQAIFWPSASEMAMRWIIRIGMIVSCLFATTIACTVNSVYGLFVLCSELIYVALFPQLFCVLYVSFSNTYGSLLGYLVGLALRLTAGESLLKLHPAIKYPGFVPGEAFYQRFPIRLMAMLGNMLVLILVSWITDFLFRRKILPKRADIFQCVVNLETSRSIEMPKSKLDEPDTLPNAGDLAMFNPALEVSLDELSHKDDGSDNKMNLEQHDMVSSSSSCEKEFSQAVNREELVTQL